MPKNNVIHNAFVVRKALTEDIPRIVELDYEAFAWSNTQEDESVFLHRLQVFPAGCLVVEVKNVIVGYSTCEKWLEEREPQIGEDPVKTHHPDGRVLCITGFAITATHRKQGLGTALLTTLIDIARNEQCRSIILETGEARTFYARFGFEKVGMRTQNGATMSVIRLSI